MAVRTRDEMLNAIKARIGEDTSDEAIALVEDIQDTLSDFENRANGDGVDWKKKYEENDKEWRTKYRDRFFSGTDNDDINEPNTTRKNLTFEELFKEG